MHEHNAQGARDAIAPDLQSVRARASAAAVVAGAAVLVTAGDPGQPATPVAIASIAPTVVVSAQLTPKVSGRVRVKATYKPTNDGVGTSITPTLTQQHPPVVVVIATGETLTLPAGAGTFLSDELDAVVANLTLGVQYTFILRLQANAAGHQTIATGGAQLEVEELIE